jgi:hypothetical protein
MFLEEPVRTAPLEVCFYHNTWECYRHTVPSLADHSDLVFVSELLRVCLVLKIFLILYRFPIREGCLGEVQTYRESI